MFLLFLNKLSFTTQLLSLDLLTHLIKSNKQLNKNIIKQRSVFNKYKAEINSKMIRLTSEINYLNEISQIINEDSNETLSQMKNEMIKLIIAQYTDICNNISINYSCLKQHNYDNNSLIRDIYKFNLFIQFRKEISLVIDKYNYYCSVLLKIENKLQNDKFNELKTKVVSLYSGMSESRRKVTTLLLKLNNQ